MLTLFIMSVFSIFGSIFEFSSDSQKDGYMEFIKTKGVRAYEVLKFFVNLVHIAGYFYGIQAFSKQNSSMNKNFELISISLATTNFIFLFIYIFAVRVAFFTWCLDIFFLLLNTMIYYQAKELTTLFSDKEEIRIRTKNFI